MVRRKRIPAPETKFRRSSECKIHGRTVEVGTELTIVGEGRMLFHAFVTNTETGAEWIDCIDKNKHMRSFRVEQVKRVHYKSKIRRS